MSLLVWLIIVLPGILLALGSKLGFPYFVSKAAGVAGVCAFSLSLILGCRTRWLERSFGSLGHAYHVHHQVGVAVIVLTALHLFFSALPFFAVDLPATLDFLGDLSDPVIATGWLALGLLLAGVFFSYLRSIRRRHWRWIHRTLVLAFPMSLLHFWLGASDLGAGELLAAAAGLLALIFLVLQFAIPALLRPNFSYRVTEVKALGPHDAELSLLPENTPLCFSPGQYAFFSVHAENCGISADFHPYTLDSSPDERGLRIAVRALGYDSSRLLQVKPGTLARVEGPYGNLLASLDPERPQLWIAGGIGVTPFLSYVRRWKNSPARMEKIVLIRLVKHEPDNLFASELSAVSGLRTFAHVDDQEGPPAVAELLPEDWRVRDIALSGPSVMVKRFRRELRKMGAGKAGQKIRSEEFDF